MEDCIGESCYFFMQGSGTPDPEGYCGWVGGSRRPNSKRCKGYKPGKSSYPIVGGRVVSAEDLPQELEAYQESL